MGKRKTFICDGCKHLNDGEGYPVKMVPETHEDAPRDDEAGDGTRDIGRLCEACMGDCTLSQLLFVLKAAGVTLNRKPSGNLGAAPSRVLKRHPVLVQKLKDYKPQLLHYVKLAYESLGPLMPGQEDWQSSVCLNCNQRVWLNRVGARMPHTKGNGIWCSQPANG